MKFATYTAAALILCGCVGHRNSYSIKDREPQVRLLTLDQLSTYTTNALLKPEYHENFERRLSEIFPSADTSTALEPITTAALASLLAGVVVDTVKSEMQKEAAKYEAQCTAWTDAANFWNITEAEENGKANINVIPRYAGFEFIRWSKEAPRSSGEPALHLIAALVPNPEDNRFFQVQPVYLRTTKAMAKVSRQNGKLTTRFRIGIEASYVDQKLERNIGKPVGVIDWEMTGYDLDKLEPLYFFNSEFPEGSPYIAGVFASPPLSALDEDLDGKPDPLRFAGKRATPFKVTVEVTEKDETKAAAYIERTAKFLADKKPDIQKAAGNLFPEPKK